MRKGLFCLSHKQRKAAEARHMPLVFLNWPWERQSLEFAKLYFLVWFSPVFLHYDPFHSFWNGTGYSVLVYFRHMLSYWSQCHLVGGSVWGLGFQILKAEKRRFNLLMLLSHQEDTMNKTRSSVRATSALNYWENLLIHINH